MGGLTVLLNFRVYKNGCSIKIIVNCRILLNTTYHNMVCLQQSITCTFVSCALSVIQLSLRGDYTCAQFTAWIIAQL